MRLVIFFQFYASKPKTFQAFFSESFRARGRDSVGNLWALTWCMLRRGHDSDLMMRCAWSGHLVQAGMIVIPSRAGFSRHAVRLVSLSRRFSLSSLVSRHVSRLSSPSRLSLSLSSRLVTQDMASGAYRHGKRAFQASVCFSVHATRGAGIACARSYANSY